MNRLARVLLIEPLEARIAPAEVAFLALGSLDGKTGFKLSGIANDDRAGISVSAAGTSMATALPT